MKDVTVRCVCGWDMRPLATQGPGHYRCSNSNCRNRVHVEIPGLDENRFRCEIANGTKRCTRPKERGLKLCEMHVEGLLGAMMRNPEQREFVATMVGEDEFKARLEVARQEYQRERERNRRAVQAMRPDCPVVYYVRLAPDNIKIGTTIHLPSRMDGLRVLRKEQVLAAEPGNRTLEKRRHRQFAHLRYDPRREDFKPADDLLAHVATVRDEHGDPYELAESMLTRRRRELAEDIDHQYSVID